MIAQGKTFVIPSGNHFRRIVKTSEKWKKFLARMCIENVFVFVYYVKSKQSIYQKHEYIYPNCIYPHEAVK